MQTSDAIAIAGQVFAKANEVVKAKTGESIVGAAFDLAAPTLLKQLPALAILMPIIKRVAMPMIESALTAHDYAAASVAIDTIDTAMVEFAAAAAAARDRIDMLTDAEITAYLTTEGIIRAEA
jgi:hypothetical protein